MGLTIRPGPAEGRVEAPTSKSVTHRALILSAIAGEGTVEHPLRSRDPEATIACLEALGLDVTGDDPVTVRGEPTGGADLDCANSGTTLRLLTGVAATLEDRVRLDGDESLRQRPMGPLVEALGDLGAMAQGRAAPVTVRGPLVGGRCELPGDVSSQFVSAAMLAGLGAREPVDVAVRGELVSRPYAEMTATMIADAGGEVETTGSGWRVAPSDLEARTWTVPGDWSSAAFPLALGALSGPVTVAGLDPDADQGDVAILDHLRALGAEVTVDGEAVTVDGGRLHGAEIDLSDTPDLFPALAAVAVHAQGRSRLTGAEHLKAKESDRIAAVVDGLTALGGQAKALADGAEIVGPGLSGGEAATRGDHRILMALSVAATRADDPVTLSEASSHEVSYPSFLDDLDRLGVRWTT